MKTHTHPYVYVRDKHISGQQREGGTEEEKERGGGVRDGWGERMRERGKCGHQINYTGNGRHLELERNMENQEVRLTPCDGTARGVYQCHSQALWTLRRDKVHMCRKGRLGSPCLTDLLVIIDVLSHTIGCSLYCATFAPPSTLPSRQIFYCS